MSFWAAFGSEAASLLRLLAGGGSAQAAGKSAAKSAATGGEAAEALGAAAGAIPNTPQEPGGSYPTENRPDAPQPTGNSYPSPFHVPPAAFPTGFNAPAYDPTGAAEDQEFLGESAQEAGEALLNVARSVPKVGEFVDKLVLGAKTATAAWRALRDFGKEALEQQENMRIFNGTIAESYALLERQRFRQQFESARNTAGSVRFLSNSQRMLEENLRPWRDAAQNLKNLIATLANLIATGALNVADMIPVLGNIKDALDEIGRQRNAANLGRYAEFLDDIATGKFQGPKNKRPGEGGLVE